MADNTKIEWTDATWNPIVGCSVHSPGCTNCYAMRLAGTRMKNHPTREGLTIDTKAGPVWNGEVRFNERELLKPLHWKRPRLIFVCAHSDLFHENVPDEWIDRVFAVMALSPQHTFQVLTKRADRMRSYMDRACGRIADTIIRVRRDRGDRSAIVPLAHIPIGREWWPLPNVWLGVSAEDQQRWDERVPHLRETPAAIRWVSGEPLIGPIVADMTGINWLVVGGESGPKARPMHPDWARSLRDQCAAAGVAFHFKQWGEWGEVGHDEDGPKVTEVRTQRGRDMHSARAKGPIGFISKEGHFFASEDDIRGRARLMHKIGKRAAGRLLDGVQHDDFPSASA